MAKTSLKNLFLRFVSVVDKGDNKGAKILLAKSKEKKPDKKGGVVMKTVEEILKSMDKEDMKVIKAEIDKIKDMEVAKAEVDVKVEGLESKVEELAKVKPVIDTSDEELIKSADPKIQKMLEKAEEVKVENETLKKEKVEEIAKARKVELSKEAELYPNLGSPVEDIVEIFSKLDGDEKTMELVKGIFGAVNKALEGTELLKTIGTEKEPIVKSSEEELVEKAKAMVEKDGITIEAAKTKIIKSDPNKYMK